MHHLFDLASRSRPATLACHTRRWPLAPLATAALLAACGGGDGTPTEPVSPSPTPTLAVTGTAATGAALAGREVQAKCATGTGAASTGTNGSFSISIANGALPCVLRTTLADGTALLSTATGSGSAATGNITPLSHWVVARLAGTDPQTLYDSFDASKLTPAAVDGAVTAVLKLAKDAGIDFTAYGNPLTATLSAANGSTAGNDFDKALDALKVRMDSVGLTLDGMATTLAVNAPGTTQQTSTVSLPPELLLQPKAAHCSALRSGNYRILIAMPSGAAGSFATGTMRIDATALTTTDTTPVAEGGNTGETSAFTPIAGQPCRFNTENGTATVAGSGVIVFNSTEDGVARVGLAVPMQDVPVSALEGVWNGIGQHIENGVRANRTSKLSFGPAGQITALSQCLDMITCTDFSSGDLPTQTVQADPSGGFKLRDNSGYQYRLVAFRPGGGIPVVISLNEFGYLTFYSKVRTLILSAVPGDLSSSWGHTITNNLTAAAVSESANTIVSTDAATGRYQRDAIFNLTTGATQRETLVVNDPRNGYTRRLAETVTGSDGSTRNVSPWILMNLPGAGFTPVALQTAGQGLIISVGKAQ